MVFREAWYAHNELSMGTEWRNIQINTDIKNEFFEIQTPQMSSENTSSVLNEEK